MSVDPREKRREGSRRAQAARARREDAVRKRKNRNLAYGIGGVLAVVAAIVGLVLFAGGGEGPGIAVETQGNRHVTPQQIEVFNYNTSPPTSGPHLGRWNRTWGFQGGTLIVGEVVHNMEHGGVVVWYQPDNPSLAGQVNQLVAQLGDQCLIAGSYADMEATVAVTAWGRILTLEQWDEQQVRDFIDAYRAELGPEAGVCRTNP